MMKRVIAKLFNRIVSAIYACLWKEKVVGLDFAKMHGYVMVVVQDAKTMSVLMVGVAAPEAVLRTAKTGHVTFWSRTRHCLWTKGESSGNYLKVREIRVDCDFDTFLVLADPVGPTCHTGAVSCFQEEDGSDRLLKIGD